MSKNSLTDPGKQDKPEPSEKAAVVGVPKAAVAAPAPKADPFGLDGRKRVIIEGVAPEIDGGRFPIKRTVGETVVVEADVFTDGHDSLSCVLQYRKAGETAWQEVPMRFLVNDRWRGEFPAAAQSITTKAISTSGSSCRARNTAKKNSMN